MIRSIALWLFATPALAGGGIAPPDLGTWLLSSLMVIGLILLLGWLLKKSRLASVMGGGQLRIIASLPLGYKEKLLVVKAGEQQLLIGVTPQQVSFLCHLASPLDESQPQAFSQQLGKLMGQHEKN